MRIVVDLDAGATPATVQLVRALAACASPHECWVAASHPSPASLAPLRAAFASSAAQVRVFDLPAPEHGASVQWRTGARELMRAGFFAALAADVLYVPAAGAPSFDPAYATVSGASTDSDPAQLCQRLLAAARARPAPVLQRRPRLAYVSPLRPLRSGIANYSAALAPELARHYDIELVAAQASVDDPRLLTFPLRTPDWFERNAQGYDRVLYHFGNSQAHDFMFALLERHPGVVVLHDFFLSGVLDNLEREGSVHTPSWKCCTSRTATPACASTPRSAARPPYGNTLSTGRCLTMRPA